jgi:hypothetical protein
VIGVGCPHGISARDLRHGLRRVVATPGFTALAILTLALGLGANVAIFTVVNAVLIRPLPFLNPDRLVRSPADARATNGRNIGISQPELDDLRDRAGVFEASPRCGLSAHRSLAVIDRTRRSARDQPRLLSVARARRAFGRVYGPRTPRRAFPTQSSSATDSGDAPSAPRATSSGARSSWIPTLTRSSGHAARLPPSRRDGARRRRHVGACGFAAAPFVSPPQRQQNFIPA